MKKFMMVGILIGLISTVLLAGCGGGGGGSSSGTTTLFVATENEGLWVSTDGGATFPVKYTNTQLGSTYLYCVYVSGSTIIVGDLNGFAISTNSGSTWTLSSIYDSFTANSVNAIYISGNTLYLATNQGVFTANFPLPSPGSPTDNTFTHVPNLTNWCTSIYGSGSTIIVGTTANGVYMTTNSGAVSPTWTNYTANLTSAIFCITVANNKVYAGCEGSTGGISVSDLGSSLSFTHYYTNANLCGTASVKSVYKIRVTSDNTLYAATEGGLSVASLPIGSGTSFTNYGRINNIGDGTYGDTCYCVFVNSSGIYAGLQNGLSISTNLASPSFTKYIVNTTPGQYRKIMDVLVAQMP